jgi:hypothetical protein
LDQAGTPSPFDKRLVASGSSIEYERIICEVLGRHLFRACHHFEWIKRCRIGDTGLAGGDRRPSCDGSHDETGSADCEECLAHLSSPFGSQYLRVI